MKEVAHAIPPHPVRGEPNGFGSARSRCDSGPVAVSGDRAGPRHKQTRPQADRERRRVGNARIWGGIHFRSAVEDGVTIGKKAVDYVLAHNFRKSPQRSGEPSRSKARGRGLGRRSRCAVLGRGWEVGRTPCSGLPDPTDPAGERIVEVNPGRHRLRAGSNVMRHRTHGEPGVYSGDLGSRC